DRGLARRLARTCRRADRAALRVRRGPAPARPADRRCRVRGSHGAGAGGAAVSAETRRVLVVIPTYDERDSLPITLDRVRAAVPSADVLVVDDASPDGTGALADERAREDRAIHVLHRAGKAGLGAAYVAGFGWA